jgi:hypothetical protein
MAHGTLNELVRRASIQRSAVTLSRRGFLQLLGGAAATAAVAPMLAWFPDDTTEIQLTPAQSEAAGNYFDVLREIYGGPPLRDLIYAQNQFLLMVKGMS